MSKPKIVLLNYIIQKTLAELRARKRQDEALKMIARIKEAKESDVLNIIQEYVEFTYTKDTKICSICGEPFTGYGNNAQPINDGICCDYCDNHVVLPQRLINYYKKEK